MSAAEPLPPVQPPTGPAERGQLAQLGEPFAPALVAAFAAALAEAELALLAQTAQGEGGAGFAEPPLPFAGDLGAGLAPPFFGSGGISGAQAVAGPAPVGSPAPAGVGERIVRIAESQVGQHEEPLGSNEGAAIARYRSATRGAIPGAPWCAYFVSWVAREAGVPLGAEGQGFGAVSEIWQWAQETHRAISNGPGVVPKPGDLIVFGDQHVGIVRRVLPDGMIETIEGNYENKVALNVRSPSEPTGYVEL